MGKAAGPPPPQQQQQPHGAKHARSKRRRRHRVDDAQREETSHLIADLPAATVELQLPAARDLHWRDAAAPAAGAPDDYGSRSDDNRCSDSDSDGGSYDDEGGLAACDSSPGLDDPPDLLPLLPGEEPLAAEVALGLVAPQLGAADATAAGGQGEEGEESDSEEEDSDAEGAGSEQEAGPAAAAVAPPSREQCYRQVRDAAAPSHACLPACLPACHLSA